ncbi:MAG: hypothetical protein QME57_04120 [Patescibacteria group bacterium]|nr:hypothetical protein [Patescibacteria group bacterium]
MEVNPILKQVAMVCNLKCRYCFYSKQTRKRQIINNETLETLIKEVCDNNSDTTRFYWHGDKPLLAGLEFYEKVVELQQKFKKPFQEVFNDLVTNATGYKRFSTLGNISERTGAIINSKNFRSLKNHLQTIQEKCSPCQWYGIRKGGCPFHHYFF